MRKHAPRAISLYTARPNPQASKKTNHNACIQQRAYLNAWPSIEQGLSRVRKEERGERMNRRGDGMAVRYGTVVCQLCNLSYHDESSRFCFFDKSKECTYVKINHILFHPHNSQFLSLFNAPNKLEIAYTYL